MRVMKPLYGTFGRIINSLRSTYLTIMSDDIRKQGRKYFEEKTHKDRTIWLDTAYLEINTLAASGTSCHMLSLAKCHPVACRTSYNLLLQFQLFMDSAAVPTCLNEHF